MIRGGDSRRDQRVFPGGPPKSEPGKKADSGDAERESRGKRDRQRFRYPQAAHEPAELRRSADHDHPDPERDVREDGASRSQLARRRHERRPIPRRVSHFTPLRADAPGARPHYATAEDGRRRTRSRGPAAKAQPARVFDGANHGRPPGGASAAQVRRRRRSARRSAQGGRAHPRHPRGAQRRGAQTRSGARDGSRRAARGSAYREAAARYPELVVPEVVYERSARRVLCLQRIHGKPLLELMESDAPGDERFRVARLLIFAIWGPFYAARLVHSDPHPGNFFVLPRGKLGVLDFGSTKMLSERFGSVYRVFLEENAAGRVHPDVGPMLKKAGFRFLGDDEEDAFEVCQKLADIVQRPIASEEYDFGSDGLVQDVRRAFRSDPRIGLTIKPPPEALLFYRSAAGLAQDLRLLKARGPVRAVLKEIQERGSAW